MVSQPQPWHSSSMPSITIDLPPELDRILRDQVASGLYADATDVIREALRRLDAEEAATQGDLKAALIVENDLGWAVANADAIFATANQRTSSVLESVAPLLWLGAL